MDRTKIMQCSFKYVCFAILAVGLASGQSEENVKNALECTGRPTGAPCKDHWTGSKSVCLEDTCVHATREGACTQKINNDVCTYGIDAAGLAKKGRCQIVSSPDMVDGTDRLRANATGFDKDDEVVGYKLATKQQTLSDAPAVGPLECYTGEAVVAVWNDQQCNFAEPSVTEGKRCTFKQFVGFTQDGNANIMVPTTELDADGEVLDKLVLQPQDKGLQIIGHKESICETEYAYFKKGDLGYKACGDTDSSTDTSCRAAERSGANRYDSGSRCLDVSADRRFEVPCNGKEEGAACSYETIEEVVWECGWQKDKDSAGTIELLWAQISNTEVTQCDSSGTEKTGWKKCSVPGKCWASPVVDDDITYEMEPNGIGGEKRKQEEVLASSVYSAADMKSWGWPANETVMWDIPGKVTAKVTGVDLLSCERAEELRDEDLVCAENNVNPAYEFSPSSTLTSSAFVVAVCGALHAVATIV